MISGEGLLDTDQEIKAKPDAVKLFDYLKNGGAFVIEYLKCFFDNEPASHKGLRDLLEYVERRNLLKSYVDRLCPEDISSNIDGTVINLKDEIYNGRKLKRLNCIKEVDFDEKVLKELIKNRQSYVSKYLLEEESINEIKAYELLEYINIIKENEYNTLWEKINKDTEKKLFKDNKEKIYSGEELLIHNLDKLLQEAFIRKIWQPLMLSYIYNDKHDKSLNALYECWENLKSNNKTDVIRTIISVFMQNAINDLDYIDKEISSDIKETIKGLISKLHEFNRVAKPDQKEFYFFINAIKDKAKYSNGGFDVTDSDVSNINDDDLSNLIAKLNLYEDCLNDLIAQGKLDRNSMVDNGYLENKPYLDKYGNQLSCKDVTYITENLFELSNMSFIDKYPEIKQVVDKNKNKISFRKMIVVTKLKDLLLCIDGKLKVRMREKLPEFDTVQYKQAGNHARKRSSIEEFFIKNQKNFRNLAIFATSILALYNGVTLALGLNVYVLMLSMSSLSANLLAAAIANIACISTTTISCFVYASSCSIAYRASSSAGPDSSFSEACSGLQRIL